MVTEEGDRAVFAGEVDDGGAVGPTVHEVAEQHEPVFGLEIEEAEELGKFFLAAVDVADGDEASVHALEKC